MTKVPTIFVAVLVFALSAGGSFAMSTILAESGTFGDEPGRPLVVSTGADAEDEVGYEVAALASIPEDYVSDTITVGVAKTPSNSRSVTQRWGDPHSQGMIILHQEPTLDGLIEGEPVDIRGQAGEIARYPERPGRSYPMVAYFWHEGDMGYTLLGALSGGMTEDDVRQIAESVETR